MWFCFSGTEWQNHMATVVCYVLTSKADGCEVISQAGPEAIPGLFRPWVNTILELDISKLILEAGSMALSSSLAMLRWLCVVMMFGPECQLNFQLW